MKSIVYTIFISLIVLTSCGGDNSNKETKGAETEKVSSGLDSTMQTSEFDNCNEFLDKYEEWSNDYIKLLTSFTSNPADPKLAQEYNRLNREYANWTNEWVEFADCTNEKEYLARYNKINRKIEKKQKALRGG